MIEVTFLCKKCNTHKDKSRFNIDLCKNNGLTSYCKECKTEYDKNYRNENRVEVREKGKVKNRKRRQTLKGRFESYVHSAKQRDFNFTLTFEQFLHLTSQKCYYCNEFSRYKDFCGIDRFDSDIGYQIENCVSCCAECNYMKRYYQTHKFLEKS